MVVVPYAYYIVQKGLAKENASILYRRPTLEFMEEQGFPIVVESARHHIREEIERWCNERFTEDIIVFVDALDYFNSGEYDSNHRWYFRNRNDAMLFKLKWR